MGEALNLEVNGKFILRCLELYWGDGRWLLVLFAAGCVFTLFRQKGANARIFAWSALLLCLTVYNPLLIRFLVPRVVGKEVYYRLFWLMPVTVGVAYDVVLLAIRCPRQWMRGAALAIFFGAALALGGINTNLRQLLAVPDNIYKVPPALVWACDEIHKDYREKEEQIRAAYQRYPANNAPRAVFAEELEVYVRQYDPSLFLGINRNTRLRYNGSTVVGEVPSQKEFNRSSRVLDVIGGNLQVPMKRFRRAMKRLKITYLVISSGAPCREYLLEAGCEVVGEGGGYTIYRYIPQ